MTDSFQNTASTQINESRLREVATHFAYPPTPDIAGRERRRLQGAGSEPRITGNRAAGRVRLLAGAAALAVLLLFVALLVPQTRAALLQIFDIGAVRFLADDEPARSLPETRLPETTLLDLAGETSLAGAAGRVNFELRLPEYPADLGPPDRVFLQQLVEGGRDQVVILVWLDPSRPDQARLSLYHIGVPLYGLKQASRENVLQTTVNGQPAAWVEGPHRLQLQGGDFQEWYLVPGNALVWTDGELTYRLESGLSMDEAIRIAESLARME